MSRHRGSRHSALCGRNISIQLGGGEKSAGSYTAPCFDGWVTRKNSDVMIKRTFEEDARSARGDEVKRTRRKEMWTVEDRIRGCDGGKIATGFQGHSILMATFSEGQGSTP
jgi:hypothetical protein